MNMITKHGFLAMCTLDVERQDHGMQTAHTVNAELPRSRVSSDNDDNDTLREVHPTNVSGLASQA